jgi:hypothetical protein
LCCVGLLTDEPLLLLRLHRSAQERRYVIGKPGVRAVVALPGRVHAGLVVANALGRITITPAALLAAGFCGRGMLRGLGIRSRCRLAPWTPLVVAAPIIASGAAITATASAVS